MSGLTMGHIDGTVCPIVLTEEIKVRLTPSTRSKVEALAAERELKMSDIIRDAVRLYLPQQPELSGPVGAPGVEVAA